jgi:hypothetical protein
VPKRLLALLTIAAFSSLTAMSEAHDLLARDAATGGATEQVAGSVDLQGNENGPAQPSGTEATRLRRGTRVQVRTARAVDLPGVVTMNAVDGELTTTTKARIVAQSHETVSVCPSECTEPIVVPKPNTQLTGKVLGDEAGILRLDIGKDAREIVTLPVAAVADVSVIKPFLSGASVEITVGSVMESPAPPLTRFVAQVADNDDEALLVRLPGHSEVITVPHAAITSLKVQVRKTRGGRGALIGAGIGLATGVGLLAVDHSRHPCSSQDFACGLGADIVAVTGVTAVGALLGLVVGSGYNADHWENVDTRRLGIALGPDLHGGIRGGLSLRF